MARPIPDEAARDQCCLHSTKIYKTVYLKRNSGYSRRCGQAAVPFRRPGDECRRCARMARVRLQGRTIGLLHAVRSPTTTSGPAPRSARRRPRVRTWRRSPRSPPPPPTPRRCGVGCRVFCIDYHVPAVLAKEVATLDLLSDGRLETRHRSGLERDRVRGDGPDVRAPRQRGSPSSKKWSPSSRRTAPETNSPAPASTSTSAATQGTPRPVQRPHPPIMIGGGRKRVLSYAGARGRHRQHQHGAVRRPQRRRADPAAGSRAPVRLRPRGRGCPHR